MFSHSTRLHPYRVFLIQEFAASLAFAVIFTVNMVYQVEIVHLNPLQLVLVGTTLELTAFLCEIPTGVLADVYSRRLSVIVGFVLVGLGYLLSAVPQFEAILVSQVVAGVGFTFMSGALQAWVADELGEASAGRAYLRGAQVGALGELVGIGLSTVLASWRLVLPILAGGLGLVSIALFLALAMPEQGFRPAPREQRNSWQHFMHTFAGGLSLARSKPVLLTILVIAIIQGAFSEGYDRLWTPHLLNDITLPALGPFQPVVWFGLIAAAGTLLSLAATEIVRRRVDTARQPGVARALLLITSLLGGAVLAFGLTSNFALALVALLVIKPVRMTVNPLTTAWLNQSLEPRVRATVFSMAAQMDALGQIGGGPALGLLATVVSLPAALVVSGLLLGATLPLYARRMNPARLARNVDGLDGGPVDPY